MTTRRNASKTDQPEPEELRRHQELVLNHLAKALVRGEREYARRLLHTLLREPKARITDAKRLQLEVWLQQLKTPDPDYGKAELMRLLLEDRLSDTLTDFLTREHRQLSDQLERMALALELIGAVSAVRRKVKRASKVIPAATPTDEALTPAHPRITESSRLPRRTAPLRNARKPPNGRDTPRAPITRSHPSRIAAPRPHGTEGPEKTA